MFRLYVDQASIKTKAIEPLTSGRVGLKVQISFNQDWLNLTKIVSYEYRTPGEPTVEIQDEEFDGVVSTVPAGVLENSGGELYIAIKGINDGKIVIPTIYALLGVVWPSVASTPDQNHNDDYIYKNLESSIVTNNGIRMIKIENI